MGDVRIDMSHQPKVVYWVNTSQSYWLLFSLLPHLRISASNGPYARDGKIFSPVNISVPCSCIHNLKRKLGSHSIQVSQGDIEDPVLHSSWM